VLEHALGSRPSLPAPAIPITNTRWQRFVARTAPWPDALRETSTLVTAAATGDFRTIQHAAARCVAILRRLDTHTHAAGMFDHPNREALTRLHETLGTLGSLWFEALVSQSTASTPTGTGIVASTTPDTGVSVDVPVDARVGTTLAIDIVEQCLVFMDGSKTDEDLEGGVGPDDPDDDPDDDPMDGDPWVSAFGVPREVLDDSEHRFAAHLLVLAFHGRGEELDRRLTALFEPFAPLHMATMKLLNFAQSLLDARDPVEVALTAIQIRDFITARHAAEPVRTSEALATILNEVNRSHASSVMVREVMNRRNQTKRQDTRAMLTLEAYRRVCEAQVKPWAWTLVRLHTGAQGAAPALSQLSDRLSAIGDETATSFAQCIEPTSRNAAAHEDYHWDARRQLLICGDSEVAPEMLDRLMHRGHGLMSGCELGWALACGDRRELAADMRAAEGVDVPLALTIDHVLSRFSSNHVEARNWEMTGDCLVVEIAALPMDRVNPCAQALLEASTILREAAAFRVHVDGDDRPAMVATRPSLEAMIPSWVAAYRTYAKMPPAVFLPTLFESRLLVESPQVAVQAALYFALNEAVHFLDDFHDRRYGPLSTASLTALATGLGLAHASLEGCALALPDAAGELLGRAHRAIRGAARYATDAANSAGQLTRHETDPIRRMESKIRELWRAAPPCAVLPTIDPTPLAPST